VTTGLYITGAIVLLGVALLVRAKIRDHNARNRHDAKTWGVTPPAAILSNNRPRKEVKRQ
jgi:hypothetical protein